MNARKRYITGQALPKLFGRMAEATARKKLADAERKRDQSTAVDMMREAEIKEFEIDGLRAVLVDEQNSTVRDDDAILAALPAEVVAQIVSIDAGKLAEAVKAGLVSADLVKEHTTTHKVECAPYVKVTIRAKVHA